MMPRFVFVAVCVVLFLAGAAFALDQGITGQRHRENVGKIVFAKERIKLDAQDSIPLAQAFAAEDPLYGRAYLPKNLAQLGLEAAGGACPNPAAQYRIKAFIDGRAVGALNEQHFDSPAWTTVQLNLRLSPGDSADGQNSGVPAKWQALLKDLPDGEHQVKLELWGGPPNCERAFAEGGFTLAKSGAVKAAGGKTPEPLLRDAALEREMAEAVEGQGWTNEHPVRVVIIEPDWRLVRNALNIVTDREINTHVVLKRVKDGACRANDISFRQPHKGGGAFGKTLFYGMGLKSYETDCE